MPIYISIISTLIALFSLCFSITRDSKKNIKEDNTQLTTVLVKLEKMSEDISEIKRDVRDLRSEIKDHSERLVKLEQQIETLNKEIFKNSGG